MSLFNFFRNRPLPARRVVYTVIIGQYDGLNETPAPNATGIPHICFTDDPARTSDRWHIVHVEGIGLDATRESRRMKLLAHEFLQDFTHSLYIDASIQLKMDPAEIFEQYLDAQTHPFTAMRHPWRGCLYDEAEEVIRLLKDDEHRVREQVDTYRQHGFPAHAGLVAGGFQLRSHHHPQVIAVMEAWFYHVLRYSKRDQISFPFVAWQQGFAYNTIDMMLNDNLIFKWPANVGTRPPSNFDEDTYTWLNPDVADSGENPTRHYLAQGIQQNRPYRYFEPLPLNQLANRHRSNRGNLYHNRHFYSRIYQRYLKPLRDEHFTLFEIGRHDDDARSLRMWSDYFPHAHIIGYTSTDSPTIDIPRCTLIHGEPGSRDDLATAIAQLEPSPAVIIDDGSHTSPHQQMALGYLFQQLEPGGLYFIENLHHSDAAPTLDVLRALQQNREITSPHMPPDEIAYLQAHVESVAFYDSMDYQSENTGQDALAVIQKQQPGQ
ncbi:MAG: glycosyltransferase domain-containing protein [Chloroflexota bacterium]